MSARAITRSRCSPEPANHSIRLATLRDCEQRLPRTPAPQPSRDEAAMRRILPSAAPVGLRALTLALLLAATVPAQPNRDSKAMLQAEQTWFKAAQATRDQRL